MKTETLKRIFDFLEEKENHNAPFRWKILNNIPIITKEELQSLIILLAEIVASNKIITKDEKKELDKKISHHHGRIRRHRAGEIYSRQRRQGDVYVLRRT